MDGKQLRDRLQMLPARAAAAWAALGARARWLVDGEERRRRREQRERAVAAAAAKQARPCLPLAF